MDEPKKDEKEAPVSCEDLARSGLIDGRFIRERSRKMV